MLRFLAFLRIFMTAEGRSSAMHKYFSHAQPDNNALGIYDKRPATLLPRHRTSCLACPSGGFLSCLCVIFSRTIRRPHNVNRLPLKRVHCGRRKTQRERGERERGSGCAATKVVRPQMLLLRFRLSAGSPWQRTTGCPPSVSVRLCAALRLCVVDIIAAIKP